MSNFLFVKSVLPNYREIFAGDVTEKPVWAIDATAL